MTHTLPDNTGNGEPKSLVEALNGTFANDAPIYAAHGMPNTIPIPKGRKSPPPDDFTGHGHKPVSEQRRAEWCRTRGDWGIAIVLADDQQGVDIDNYAKDGREAGVALRGIAEIEERTRCEYPETACLYHDDDGSAKFLYRCTSGVQWRGGIAPRVEILSHNYRYAHVGINPRTGKLVRWGWGRPGGVIRPVDDPLPPEKWAVLPERLEAEHAAEDNGRLRSLATPEQAEAWLRRMPEGPMSYFVGRELQRAVENLSGVNGAVPHDVLLNVRNLVEFGAAELPGARTALAVIQTYLIEARKLDPQRASDTGEFQRMLDWAAKRCNPDTFNALRILDQNGGRIPNLPRPSGANGETPAGGDPTPTWAPVDMRAERLHHGNIVPTLAVRVDGEGLFYAGKVHSLHGETESGKSWIAQYAAAQCLLDNEDTAVLYVDFEDNAADVGERLVRLGVPPEIVDDPARFVYVHPSFPLSVEAERDAFGALLSRRFSFAVIDGVTEAMALAGLSTDRNTEVAAWQLQQPRAIATQTGAAVVCIDHVTKDADTRGRHAIGSQHKLAGLDGAAFVVEVEHPFGEGKTGMATVRIAKDRPGKLRGRLGIDYRPKDQTHLVTKFRHDATDPEHVKASLEVPTGADATTRGKAKKTRRPAREMEAVSDYWDVTSNPRQRTKNKTESAVMGSCEGVSRQAVRDAINLLETEGYATYDGRCYTNTKRYHEGDDPKSDKFRLTIHVTEHDDATDTANDLRSET